MDKEYLKLEKKEVVLVASLIIGVFMLLALTTVRNERIRQQSQAQTPAEIGVQVLSPLSDVELSGTTASVDLRSNSTNGTQVLYDAQAQGEAAVLEFMDKNPVVDVAAVSDNMQVKGASTNPELKRVLPANFKQNSVLRRTLNDRMFKDKGEVKRYYYEQKIAELPVYGGTVRFDLVGNDKVVGVDGDYTTNTNAPTIKLSDKEATDIAIKAATKDIQQQFSQALPVVCSNEAAERIIYNEKLAKISENDTNNAVLNVTLCDHNDQVPHLFKTAYFVSLETGRILKQHSLIQEIMNRKIYNCKTLGCTVDDYGLHYPRNPAVARSEGQGVVSDKDVNTSYDFLGDIYKYYLDNFQRDSYDNRGATINAFVHIPISNAFWDGQQMAAGNGFVTKDIWAHELTHAVTSSSSRLGYDGQEFALNESISDMFSVGVDPGNWTIGEGIGRIIRNLQNPPSVTSRLNNRNVPHPDRLFSTNYDCSNSARWTNGEPHHNAGVTNKAFYLMAVGGSFNGCNINAIGREKALQIVYKTNTNYLSKTSNFLDFYNKVNQACGDIYGPASSECANVKAAMQATEIDQQKSGTQAGPSCPGGSVTRKTPACAGGTQPTVGPTAAAPTAAPTAGGGSTSTHTPTPAGPGDPNIAVIQFRAYDDCKDSTGATYQYFADFVCSNGFKGTVGDKATCKAQDFLREQAEFKCAHSGPAATATPTPIPGTGGTNTDPTATPTPIPPTRTPYAAYLQLNPTTKTAEIGDTVRFDVIVNTGSNNTQVVDALINYDKNMLEAVDIIDGAYLSIAKKEIKTTSQVYIAGLLADKDVPVTGAGKLATLVFKVIANGSSNISFACTPGLTTDSNIIMHTTTTDIIQCSSNNTATVSAGKGIILNLELKFQGINRQPARNSGVMTARIGITGGTLDAPVFKLAQFQADTTGTFYGDVDFPDVPAGSGYRILVKGPTHIQKKVCHARPLEQVTGEYRCANSAITLKNGDNDFDFSNIRVLVGDVDQNGVVNSFDLAFVRNSIVAPSEANLEKCDVNWDGVCNGVDYGLMGAAISVKTEDE